MSPAKYLQVVLMLVVLLASGRFNGPSQSANNLQQYRKEGLSFNYLANWELSEQSNQVAQQLVLTEKTLDAQIMIIALRKAITNSKEEEEARAAVIEPSIARLLKQYEDVGIKVERVPATAEVAGLPAEGAHLTFTVDRQAGATHIYWRVLNRRLVQLFFIRPEKTAAKTVDCWNTIRSSLSIQND